MTIRHVVSVSGGKDSTATLLIALERFGRERVQGGSVVVRIEPMQSGVLAMFAREMERSRDAA